MFFPNRSAERDSPVGARSLWPFGERGRVAAGLVLLSAGCWAGCSTIEGPGWGKSAANRMHRLLNTGEEIPLTAQEREAKLAKARVHWQLGDELFRRGAAKERGEGAADFKEAAKQFGKAAKAHPGSAIAQDALFMQGESYFFADELPEAEKTYGRLQKEYPNSRHTDRAAGRLFSIAQYWIETERAGGSRIMPVNFVDQKRPWFDVDGHGIRVLDQIRYDDPSGKLADDATMAAAVEHFRQERFADADEFLTDLRETFTDSEHVFTAYMLGIRCKLEMYAGPKYSQLTLDEADKLIRQVRTRFPDKMKEPEVRDTVARAAAEVDYRKAERLYVRAQYREKRREYGAARLYYQQLLADFGRTPYAEQATERIAVIEPLPAVPEKPLIWLTKVFPESKPAKPLVVTGADTVMR